MQLFYKITPKNRWRLILTLSVVLILILLFSLVENKNLKSINSDFTSLYKDRLIPAAETYFIAEKLHEKRLLLEQLKGRKLLNASSFTDQLIEGNAHIDSLTAEYAKTYFVNEESKVFKNFRKNLEEYLVSEKKIIRYIEDNNIIEANYQLNRITFPILAHIKADLHQLAAIQAKVGNELVENSQSDVASNHMLYYLRFGLTILVWFFMLTLVRTSPILSSSEIKKKYGMKVVKDNHTI